MTKLELETYQGVIPEECATLLSALARCTAVLRQWHGRAAFDIYFSHSPEMAHVRAAFDLWGFKAEDVLRGDCFLTPAYQGKG